MDIQKHRSLVFADSYSATGGTPMRCLTDAAGNPMTVITPDGVDGTMMLPFGDEPPPDPAGSLQIVPSVGRFPGYGTWDSKEPGISQSIQAVIFPNVAKSFQMVTWKGQNFGVVSTGWENFHSPLVNPSVRPSPMPVVDNCGAVVGYYLKKVSTNYLFTNDAGEVFYASTLSSSGNYSVHEPIVGRDLYIKAANTVNRSSDERRDSETRHTTVQPGPGEQGIQSTHVVGGYTYRVRAERWADVLLDIDGFVQVLDTYGDARKKSAAEKYDDAVDSIPLIGWLMPRVPLLPPDECFEDWSGEEQMEAYCSAKMTGFLADSMMLMMDILSLGSSKLARNFLNVGRSLEKTAMKGVRATTLALKLELQGPKLLRPVEKASQKIARIVLPDGRLAETAAIRVSKGYDAAMGIPKSHFTKMVEAAKEANGIAVFRANKSAAIPLIEGGAHPKPKYYNAFKTSKDTGVLTAKEQAHIETAYQHGDYVVDKDLVPRRAVMKDGKRVMEELKLNHPNWTLEQGQVIKPDGIPIVGDYDLLGFLPNESPGRVVVEVPPGHKVGDVKGDWVGPDVQRYQKAVNAKFDQPRVLHGAQDGFQHPTFGGLTDDTAYAVYGNGEAVILEGRNAQDSFYKAYRRETVRGAHPRPSPGTPVVDELAARRARNPK
jgi:hypothetical protein